MCSKTLTFKFKILNNDLNYFKFVVLERKMMYEGKYVEIGTMGRWILDGRVTVIIQN